VDDKLFIKLVPLFLPYFWLKGVNYVKARLALGLSTKSIKSFQMCEIYSQT
jgi:hypothetical protein